MSIQSSARWEPTDRAMVIAFTAKSMARFFVGFPDRINHFFRRPIATCESYLGCNSRHLTRFVYPILNGTSPNPDCRAHSGENERFGAIYVDLL
jgi:hypothetical protein